MNSSSEIQVDQLVSPQPDRKPPKMFRRVAFTIFIGLVIIAVIPSTLISAFPVLSPERLSSPWSGAFFHTVMLLFSMLLIRIFGHLKFKEFGFRLPRSFRPIPGIISGILLGIVATILAILLSGEGLENMPGQDMSFFEVIIFIWIYASLAEEVLCRGLIQGYLNHFYNYRLTLSGVKLSLPVITGALFFALMHFALLTTGVSILPVLIIVSFALLLGLMAGYQLERTGSLLSAVLIHMAFNIGGSIAEFF
ncbi:MAG: CPBP family intramembrane metalloprotease [Calditrichia bacterium]|nr:CPBP family intramembrane metalloprotease [Calditrichia bacterium]